MSLVSFFKWGGAAGDSGELPDIFPLGMAEKNFIQIDTLNIYLKILTDVIERTHGIPEDLQHLLWDNCVQSESSDGLITMLSKAMESKKELFLVYEPAVKLIREAKSEEAQQIKADYIAKGESAIGVYISFKTYSRTDMVKLYSALEYCTVSALNKQMNLSKALQIKINKLRESVGLNDAAEAKAQAKQIAEHLSIGKDIYMDGEDSVESESPDLAAVEKSMDFLNQKRAFYLGMPAAYITGEATGGLGSTGDIDTRAIDRGLKAYFFSIVKPVLEAVLGIKAKFKPQDFRQLGPALEAFKTFELTSGELMSSDNKRIIVNQLFDLPEDAKGDETQSVDEVEVDPNAPPVDEEVED